jgi:hypothetical protein
MERIRVGGGGMTRWVQLTGSQSERLHGALLSLFDADGLERLLFFRLDVSLYSVVARGSTEDVLFHLLRKAAQQGWLDDLLLAASEARPSHPVLEGLKTELGLGKSVMAADASPLEAFVKGVGGLLDPEVFRTRLATAEAAVCRISYPRPDGKTLGGTGFLVGPDLVMTNYHVMKYVVAGQVAPGAVTVLFDYKLDSNGNTVNAGHLARLAGDWLIDCSPYSASDLQPLPVVPDTPNDELDYALIRLGARIGCQPVPSNVPGKPAGGAANDDPPRGWLTVPASPVSVAPDAPLLILQHPEVGMMKLAWDPNSVMAVNKSGTRLRHSTPTLPGSSGSPCFDASFNVVALHHAGDPAETNEVPANYNQAIPMPAIVSLLSTRQRDQALRGQCS